MYPWGFHLTDAQFDLLAAALRADANDTSTFLPVLARKLEDALPHHTVVRRKRRLLRNGGAIEGLSVSVGEDRLDLETSDGRLVGRRVRVVRDIAISSDELTIPEWVDDLSRRLAAEAETSEQARLAMERILGI